MSLSDLLTPFLIAGETDAEKIVQSKGTAILSALNAWEGSVLSELFSILESQLPTGGLWFAIGPAFKKVLAGSEPQIVELLGGKQQALLTLAQAWLQKELNAQASVVPSTQQPH